MSKTFKSSTSSRQLDVTKFGNGDLLLELYPDDNVKPKISAIDIASSDAPAVCLAILEAVGVEARTHSHPLEHGETPHLEFMADELKSYIKRAEKIAAAEADWVKLEAEALKLYNAGRKHQCMVNDATWDDLDNTTQKYWLAVARAARELNKETPDA